MSPVVVETSRQVQRAKKTVIDQEQRFPREKKERARRGNQRGRE